MHSLAKESARTHHSIVNLITGFISQLVILVLNFVVRYIFINSLGYDYLGINSLFTSILTIISVADLGFGSALGIVLYASLAKKNEEEIAGLMNFFKKVYLIIGSIVTVAGLAITPFVKYLVNTNEDIPNLSLYFLFFLINTVSSYFISYRIILIRADQKNSVVNNVTTIVKISKAILEAFVLFFFPKWFGLIPTYFVYLGVMVIATYAIGVITSIYAKKKYPYAFNKINIEKDKKKELINTTKGLFVYHLCNALSSPIDSVMISLFVGTAFLGIYSNYLMIFTALIEFICIISRNTISSVGNFVVEKPIEEQKRLYFEIQIIYFAIMIFCAINYVGLASPFIKLVFSSGSVLSFFVVILFGATLIMKCAGELAIIFRETTHIYQKTKYISLAYTALHIGLSLLLGHFIGLEGILLGNVVAYFMTNFWFEIFALFKWYFKSNPLKVFLQFLYIISVTIGCSIGSYFLCDYISSFGSEYFPLECIVSLLISLIALLVLIPITGFKSLTKRVKSILMKIFEFIKKFHNNAKIQKYVLLGSLAVLTLAIVLRDFVGLNVNKFVFFGIFAIAVLLCNKSNALMVIFFTLPFSSSLAELYIITFSLIYLVLINLKNHSIKGWITILIIPVILFGLELVLSYIYGGISLEKSFRILIILSLLAIVFYDKKLLTKKHLYAFIAGMLYLFIMIGINCLIISIWATINKGKLRWINIFSIARVFRFSSANDLVSWLHNNCNMDYPIYIEHRLGENPNNIGMMCIIGLSSLFVIYGSTRRKERFLVTLAMIEFVLFGILTQSRMFIITFALFIVFGFVALVLTKRLKAIDAAIIFLFIVMVLSIIALVNHDLVNTFIKRFSESSTSDGGGRITIAIDYMKFIFSNWKYALFGVSCTHLQEIAQIDVVPHTNFVQFIGSYGIVVFVLFVAYIVVCFIRTKGKVSIKKQEFLLFIPLIFNVIFSMTLQLFIPSIVLLSFIPSMICVSFLNDGKEGVIVYRLNGVEKVRDGEKPRILIYSLSYNGGIGSYIENVSPKLSEAGFEIAFAYDYHTPQSEIEHFDSFGLKSFKEKNERSKTFLKRFLNNVGYFEDVFDEFKPHIIYINGSSIKYSIKVLLAAKLYKNAKIIYHCHNNVKLSLIEKIMLFFLETEHSYHFACSPESGKAFFGKNFLNNKTDLVVNNFIDINRFTFDAKKRKEIRDRYNIKSDDILIGNVGRLSEAKNQQFLINLLELLPDNYKLFIIGNGGLKSALEEQINNARLNDRITLIPNNKEIDKFYCAFDYFCLPSIKEGLPFVCVEAQCCGLINYVSANVSTNASLTSNIYYLPLELRTWKNRLIDSKPTILKDRKKYAQQVEDAGFSSKTALTPVIEKLNYILNHED